MHSISIITIRYGFCPRRGPKGGLNIQQQLPGDQGGCYRRAPRKPQLASERHSRGTRGRSHLGPIPTESPHLAYTTYTAFTLGPVIVPSPAVESQSLPSDYSKPMCSRHWFSPAKTELSLASERGLYRSILRHGCSSLQASFDHIELRDSVRSRRLVMDL